MVKYWRYHERFRKTDEEFIHLAREHYGWDYPTIRGALRDLYRALFRRRKIEKALPDVPACMEYLENQEYGSSFEHNGIPVHSHPLTCSQCDNPLISRDDKKDPTLIAWFCNQTECLDYLQVQVRTDREE